MLIGTTSSTGKLQVNQSGADPLIRFQKSGTTYLIVGNNGNTALYYNIAPAYKLQLNVNAAAKPTSSSWTVSSDGRLKKDVETFSDGLNLLMQINPVWFSYTGERGVGTIAQDLQKIAPYMVHEWTYVEGSTDENNKEPRGAKRTYLGIDYGAMDFVLINSIKDQQKMIEDQQQQISILKEEIEQLKEK